MSYWPTQESGVAMRPILPNETWLMRFARHLLVRPAQLSAPEAAHAAIDEFVSRNSEPNAAAAMYAGVLVSMSMSRYQSQDQGQQRVEYWRWRVFDEARNRWNETRHVMTETDALLHHWRATKIEGSREVRDLSEPDEIRPSQYAYRGT
jgi:hypothetical protein